jgi:hypothetical protein
MTARSRLATPSDLSGCELNAIARGERLRDFPINVHAGEPPRIIVG